jgi:hypothetical protein
VRGGSPDAGARSAIDVDRLRHLDQRAESQELSAAFMLLTFVVFAGYGVFAASVRNHVVSP